MLANLRALLGVIVDIVLLRRGPDSLPASLPLLVALIAGYAGLWALIASWFAIPEMKWPAQLAVSIVFTLVWYRVALVLANKRERFVQMMTALFASWVLIKPVALPMQLTLFLQSRAEVPQPASALLLLVLCLLVWLFVITVRIVRSTFEWATVGSIAMVLAQEVVMIMLFVMLFVEPAKPA
jgi:hypothetical protein